MNEERIWVVGEALIDSVPHLGSRLAVVGGGPANTAKALVNLGLRTSFIGGISSDRYGQLIAKELCKVDLSLCKRTVLPSAQATVEVDSHGSVRFEFLLDGTATFDFHRDWLPSGVPGILYTGSLATVVEPGASELYEWISQIPTLVVFDPNIRENVVGSRSIERFNIDRWLRISNIVKLSVEDLRWLGYASPSEILDFGPDVVVLTDGERGLHGYTRNGTVAIPSVPVDVVDTVGAGDTVGAVLVEGLSKYGLELLIREKLSEVLSRAAKAAAVTCTRAGAKPPILAELES